MNNRWTLEVKEDPNTGDAILEFPPDLMEKAGWKEGDTLEWKDLGAGSYQLIKKQETLQWVMVETVSSFRHRYMVQVPVGMDDYGYNKTEWALDTVVMEEAKEFSQKHIGENIVSHRVLTEDEALELCSIDNDYTDSWTKDKKMETFFTRWNEQDG